MPFNGHANMTNFTIVHFQSILAYEKAFTACWLLAQADCCWPSRVFLTLHDDANCDRVSFQWKVSRRFPRLQTDKESGQLVWTMTIAWALPITPAAALLFRTVYLYLQHNLLLVAVTLPAFSV